MTIIIIIISIITIIIVIVIILYEFGWGANLSNVQFFLDDHDFPELLGTREFLKSSFFPDNHDFPEFPGAHDFFKCPVAYYSEKSTIELC